jgi:hypothetical protein
MAAAARDINTNADANATADEAGSMRNPPPSNAAEAARLFQEQK